MRPNTSFTSTWDKWPSSFSSQVESQFYIQNDLHLLYYRFIYQSSHLAPNIPHIKSYLSLFFLFILNSNFQIFYLNLPIQIGSKIQVLISFIKFRSRAACFQKSDTLLHKGLCISVLICQDQKGRCYNFSNRNPITLSFPSQFQKIGWAILGPLYCNSCQDIDPVWSNVSQILHSQSRFRRIYYRFSTNLILWLQTCSHTCNTNYIGDTRYKTIHQWQRQLHMSHLFQMEVQQEGTFHRLGERDVHIVMTQRSNRSSM